MLRQNRTEQNRLNNCSFAKTVMMLVIVFYHCILDVKSNWVSSTGSNEYPVISIIIDWLASFHNYTFVLISGYIFYFIKYEKERYKEFVPFVKNKAKRLIVPCIFVMLVWAIPLNCYLFKTGAFSKATINGYFLGTAPSQLWFLLMLFWVFVFFYIISDYVKNNTMIGVVLVFALHCIGVLATHFVPNFYRVFDGLGFMMFFYVGFLFRQYNIVDRIKKHGIICLPALYIVSFVLYELIKDQDSIIIKTMRVLGVESVLNITGCILAFLFLQSIADKLNHENSKVYKFCEKRSMGVYLFHQQLVHLCFMLLIGTMNVYALIPLSFVASFVISVIIHDILAHFKITKFLIGEK